MRKRNNWKLKSPSWVLSLRAYVTKRIHNLSPRQRIISASIAGVLLFIAIVPTIYHIIDTNRYKLGQEIIELVGGVNANLSAKLQYDSQGKRWQFNDTSQPVTDFSSLKAQIGGGGANDESLYSTDFYEDPTKGVVFYDSQTHQSFTMTSKFSTASGQMIDGRLIYPMDRGAKLIYTPKNNGMKEDIVLTKFLGEELSYSYKLDLPKTLEARLQDDGSVGIFSVDPILFSDISITDTMDAEKLKNAREQGEKSHLAFVIPAPVIIQTDKKTSKATARFELSGDMLTVTARDMDSVTYPASIDPSVVVTSSDDFTTDGNTNDNISTSIPGRIRRDPLGSAALNNSWESTTTLPAANYAMGHTLYNGRIYTVSGSGYGISVYYSEIGGDGTLGAWVQATSINTPRMYAGTAAYSGYLYVWGGLNTTTNTATASVEFAKINQDGSLGTWQTTTSMGTAVCRAGTTLYNGYLYSLGGSTSPNGTCSSASTGATSVVQYAPIKANGAVGSWQTTTSIAYGTSGAVIGAMAGSYNGYLYLAGGANNSGGTAYSNVQYAAIKTDGSISSWTATTSLPAATHSAGFAVQDGYITTLSNQASSTTQYYAPIYANGKVGTWQSTVNTLLAPNSWGGAFILTNNWAYYLGGSEPSNVAKYTTTYNIGRLRSSTAVSQSYTTSRERAAAIVHKGCLAIVGGYGSASNIHVNYAQSAPINSAGNVTAAWSNRGFSGSRADLAAVAYNGYLYIIGGYNGDSGTYYNDVQYAAINDDCTLGAWASTTAFDTSGNARGGISAAVYNGYLYVTGGKRGSTDFSTVRYAPINSDGTVGTWNNTTSLPTGLNRHRTIIAGDRMYLLGGTQLALPNVNNGATTGSRPTGSGYTNTYYVDIHSNGTLGSWQATTSLPRDLYEFGAVASDGYIYVAGGYMSYGTGVSSDYIYAPINSNGSIGSWSIAHNTGSSFASNSLVVNNGILYMFSGRTNTGIDNTGRNSSTGYGAILDGGGGKVSDWTNGTDLSVERVDTRATAYNGHAYVVGGSTDGGSNASSGIERGTIARQNGSLSSFTQDSHTLTQAVRSPGVAAYNGYLYAIGGNTGSSQYGGVQFAQLESSGELAGNFATGSSFTTGSGSDTGREGSCVATYNDRMYVVGGWDGSTYHNDVRYATINSDGTLGNWADSGNNFSTGRSEAGCAVIGNNLYVFGGRSSSSNYSDVQYATINSDGTLGSWKSTASFEGSRSHFITGYENGFLYIHGGCKTTGCSSGYGDLQVASVNNDGSLNPWQRQPTISTNNTPYRSTGLAYGGYFYQFGGSGVTGGADSTSYAPIESIGRIGTYSKLVDLGSPSHIESIDSNGTLAPARYAPGASLITVRTALNDGTLRSATTPSVISTSVKTCEASDPTYARYVLVTVTLDDTTNALFPDALATQSYLTDITINYTPAQVETNKRLARGKALQEGQMLPLDTCKS